MKIKHCMINIVIYKYNDVCYKICTYIFSLITTCNCDHDKMFHFGEVWIKSLHKFMLAAFNPGHKENRHSVRSKMSFYRYNVVSHKTFFI